MEDHSMSNKILIVEDNKSNWLPMKIFFESKGWDVEVAQSVNEAAGFLTQFFDAFIVDLGLRGESGRLDSDAQGGIKFVSKVKEKMIDLATIFILTARMDKGDKNWKKFIDIGVRKDNIFQKHKKPSFMYNKIVETIKKTGNRE